MLLGLLVFALIGVLAGTAARLFYSQRQTGQVIWTLILGLIGGLGGGAISWLPWPFEENRFHSGNLALAALGAALVLAVAAALAYAQDLAVRQSQAPSQ
jgi:uncharacterized membrane protein YeaQ/YmgE (transglycosylase-associated protein family)